MFVLYGFRFIIGMCSFLLSLPPARSAWTAAFVSCFTVLQCHGLKRARAECTVPCKALRKVTQKKSKAFCVNCPPCYFTKAVKRTIPNSQFRVQSLSSLHDLGCTFPRYGVPYTPRSNQWGVVIAHSASISESLGKRTPRTHTT